MIDVKARGRDRPAATVTDPKSRAGRGPRPALRQALAALALALAATVIVLAACPSLAAAHGPIAPVASDYLARITSVPAGVQAKAIDGDLRLWLQAAPNANVTVLDYLGAPYLRFSPSGVEVNRHSDMYYLNQTPVAAVPPANLSAKTPPDWQPVSSGHSYEWHDGRLHARATVALTPGSSYAGPWTVGLLLNGQPASIDGGLWHRGPPSIVWFWPIAVILLCVLAAWRVRSPALDAWIARLLALVALVATTIAALGHELHGRPTVSPLQIVELVAILAFANWGVARVLSRRAGYFAYFAIAVVATWEAVQLLPTLTNGFVLIALPAFLARAATVLGLGSGVSLALLVFRLAEAAGAASGRRLLGRGPSRKGAGARELA